MGGPGPRTACSVHTHPTLGAASGACETAVASMGGPLDEESQRWRSTQRSLNTGAVGCAKCCTVFATSGVLFLCLIGTLLTKQPLYVLGVDEPEEAAKSVFSAAWMYFAVLAASFGVLAWDRAEQRRRPVGRRPGMPEYGAISHKDDDDL